MMCYRDEIWLEFDNYTLVLHYECLEDDVFPDAEFFELKDINTSKLYIREVCLSNGTNAEEECYQENRITYTASMFAFCKQIQNKFPYAIERYVVDTVYLDDCNLWGCPENAEYGYRIYLRADFWENNSNLRELTSFSWKTEIEYQNYYLPLGDKKFSDDYHFVFLGTNTKPFILRMKEPLMIQSH